MRRLFEKLAGQWPCSRLQRYDSKRRNNSIKPANENRSQRGKKSKFSQAASSSHIEASFEQDSQDAQSTSQQVLTPSEALTGRAHSRYIPHCSFQQLSISDEEIGNEEVVQDDKNTLSEIVQLPLAANSLRQASSSTTNVEKETFHVSSFSNEDWSIVCQGKLHERQRVMFNNEKMADVHFIVGSRDCRNVESLTNNGKCGAISTMKCCRVPAHKYVLAVGSSVFYAMFYGPLSNNNMNEDIEVPDVEPVAFLNLLRYLYSDELELEPDSVLGTLYAAKKYMVASVARACINYLEKNLSARNAVLLLSQSRLFDEPDLVQRCWQLVDAQTEEATEADCFVDIDHSTLCAILERESLVCREICLFQAAQRWAIAACHLKHQEATAAAQRQQLGHALNLLRIPAMRLDEFANHVAQSGLLDLREVTDIFLHFTASEKPSLTFNSNQRRGLAPKRVHRFYSCAFRSNQWRYRGRCDSIQFQTDARIFLAGLGLYGSSNGAHDYSVRLEVKQGGQVLGQTHTKFHSDGTSHTFPVFFEKSIQIEPATWYTVSAVLDGLELSYFGQEGMTEVSAQHCNFQFQCSADSTNGTGVQGGQLPEFIYYS